MNALSEHIQKVRPVLALLCCLSGFTGCATQGPFIWVDEFSAKDAKATSPTSGEYIISPGDMLSVRVFNQDNMSAKGRVRADGKLSLPFLNDVEAAGYTPSVLAAQVQTRLKDFINSPVVTVSLEEENSMAISILGEVQKPGMYPLNPGAGLIDALAAAGGITEYASKDRLFVLRKTSRTDPNSTRIRFRYSALVLAEGSALSFKLQGGDAVVVE